MYLGAVMPCCSHQVLIATAASSSDAKNLSNLCCSPFILRLMLACHFFLLVTRLSSVTPRYVCCAFWRFAAYSGSTHTCTSCGCPCAWPEGAWTWGLHIHRA